MKPLVRLRGPYVITRTETSVSWKTTDSELVLTSTDPTRQVCREGWREGPTGGFDVGQESSVEGAGLRGTFGVPRQPPMTSHQCGDSTETPGRVGTLGCSERMDPETLRSFPFGLRVPRSASGVRDRLPFDGIQSDRRRQEDRRLTE